MSHYLKEHVKLLKKEQDIMMKQETKKGDDDQEIIDAFREFDEVSKLNGCYRDPADFKVAIEDNFLEKLFNDCC